MPFYLVQIRADALKLKKIINRGLYWNRGNLTNDIVNSNNDNSISNNSNSNNSNSNNSNSNNSNSNNSYNNISNSIFSNVSNSIENNVYVDYSVCEKVFNFLLGGRSINKSTRE